MTAAGLQWTPTDLHPGLERATVAVPIDHSDPAAGSIDIAISRLTAADPTRRRGVLVAVNGGPGGDMSLGVTIPLRFADTPLADVYDLIGFDPRGFGASAPVRRSGHLPYPPYDSRPDDAAFELIVERTEAIERDCAEVGGALRPHLTSRNTARDLDVIRQALGEERISYIGFAYGSYVGAVYGTLFGRHLDRIVLDSCVHPDWLWRRQYSMQASAIRENVDAWAAWAGQRHGTFALGGDATEVLAAVERLAERLRHEPQVGIDRTTFDGAVGNGATLRVRWADLAAAISGLGSAGTAGGTAASTLREFAGSGLRGGTYPSYGPGQQEWRETVVPAPGPVADRLPAIVHAVTSEAPWPTDLKVYRADVRRCGTTHAYGFGVARLQPWVSTFAATAPREGLTVLDRVGYAPGLIVQAEGDPLNHYAGASAMAERLGYRLIVVADDGGHEVYPEAGNAEVDAFVVGYLVDGVLPADSVTRVAGAPRPDVPADATPEALEQGTNEAA